MQEHRYGCFLVMIKDNRSLGQSRAVIFFY